MTDYLTFDGTVTPMHWGKAIYTVLRLPPDVDAALRAAGARRVEGEINDCPVNLALTTAPVIEGTFLWAGKALLDRCDITPGDVFEVRLRPADPDYVEMPEDVEIALRQAELSDTWSRLTPGKRRGLLHQVTSAKRADTRSKRIATLLAEISN